MKVKCLLNPPSEDCNDPGEILKYKLYVSVLNNMAEHEVISLLIDEVLNLREDNAIIRAKMIKESYAI